MLFCAFLLLAFSHHHAAVAGPNEAVSDLGNRVNKFVGQDLSQFPLPALDQTLGQKGKAKEQPWSGSYWALYNGSVAWPYLVPGTDSRKFKNNLGSFRMRLPAIREAAIKGALSADQLDSLSPTEKYDLYIGDTDFSLTQAVWQTISEQNDRKHEIQEWEGICHGWAPASAYVERPARKIVVPSLNSKFLIPFYPDDLKALVTLLWANSLIQDYTQTEGLRCKTNEPEVNESNGKILDKTCKGVNPAVWHLSVLGLVGQQQKSFIINKTNNKEVWNQPISHYEIQYFDPRSGRKTEALDDAILPVRRGWDNYSDSRAENAAYLVGVEMKLYYTSETDPDHHETETPDNDLVETMILRYDLELDADKRIVGGEWRYDDRSGFNPDEFKPPVYPGFIWRFQSQSPIAMSVMDSAIPLTGFAKLPASKRVELSRQAATFRYMHYSFDEGKVEITRQELRPQPLGSVIYPLIDYSHF